MIQSLTEARWELMGETEGNMDAQMRKYGRIVELWLGLAKSGKHEMHEIAQLVHFGLTDQPAPREVGSMRTAMELCDYFSRKDLGRPLNGEEKAAILGYFSELESRSSNTGCSRVVLVLPNILLALAILAVVYKSFSWWVIGLAVVAKIESGFARYLAGGGHPAAGLHVAISVVVMLASLVVSLMHVLGYVDFA